MTETQTVVQQAPARNGPGNHAVIEAESHPVAAAGMARPVAVRPAGGCPNLTAALCAARKLVGTVAESGYNTFHKYAYPRSRDVIAAARAALLDSGISLIPVNVVVNGTSRDGVERFELLTESILSHTSGEEVLVRMAWPIQVEKGKALDKSAAAADTLSQAYYLRRLLQMPIGGPENGDEPDAAAAPAKAPRQRPAAKAPERPPADGAELDARLQKFDARCAAEKLCDPGYVHRRVREEGIKFGAPEDMGRWNDKQIADAMQVAKAIRAELKQVAAAVPPKTAPAPAPPAAAPPVQAQAEPKTPGELHAWVHQVDTWASAKGWCRDGGVFAEVMAAGEMEDWKGGIETWPAEAVGPTVAYVRKRLQQLQAAAKKGGAS